MHTHTTRRVGVSRSVLASEVGSAPPDVVAFDTTTRVKGRKMNLAKKAKALFGIE
ncbi:hypothetical protein E1B28_007861 [Marasmius oreades]|uniref:Uncharacterized protein n=1 Tax=Marasmius oreades TaxID=181124 RepID=A0A9P7S2R8_9AGAR|nr:uncharacterized protein E1B28_007861 [Marasmius oreades]KAG7094257.1 hypothetical protein E1B28_007861 [Marasmius oreades]